MAHDRGCRICCTEDDPLFPNWDQDASAVTHGYEAQDPAQVVDELAAAALDHAVQLNRLRDLTVGPSRDWASFTVSTITRYMIHDPIHHLWDIGRPTLRQASENKDWRP